MENYQNSTDRSSVIGASLPAAAAQQGMGPRKQKQLLRFLFGIRPNNEYFVLESKGPLDTDLEHPVASLEGPTIRFLEVLG
jgi:hypothetical protein